MLETTNLFLNPNEVTDEQTCFQASEVLIEQLKMHVGQKKLDLKSGVYIWGTEEVGRRVEQLLEEFHIPLLGIFDGNSKKHGESFGLHKIQPPRQVDNYVIVCSYHQPRHLEEARELLGERALAAWELLILKSETRYLPWNNLRRPTDLTAGEKKKLSELSKRIHAKSVPEYWKQVAARHFVGILHTNQSGMFSNEEEYLVPGIIKTEKDSVFLDLGAYTGDTIERFFNQKIGMEDRRRAIGVEADRNNYAELLSKFKTREEIVLLNAVINSNSGVVPFSQATNSMGSSALFFEANTIIPAITIDQIFEKMRKSCSSRCNSCD